VYVNLPDDADEQTREQHRVGLISFFGLEQTTRWGARDPQPLSYSFDVTNLVADEAAEGQMGALRVALLPLEGTAEDPSAAAAAAPPINVGTLALRVAHD